MLAKFKVDRPFFKIMAIMLGIQKYLAVGSKGRNLIQGPILGTLLVLYGNYLELILYLDQDLVVLPSAKEHFIFTKRMHRLP